MKEALKEIAGWSVLALLFLALVWLVVGCAAVNDKDGGTVYVPAWPADPETGAPDTEGFPWWLKAGVGAAVAVAAPRSRRNLVGIVGALASREPARAAAHVAALTPFFGSPTEALPPKQREAVEVVTAVPNRSDP